MCASCRRRGFSLIELLVVLAIMALLAAIAIPMTINALNRSKQAKTMATIRAIAQAWEQRAADKRSYNAAGATFNIPGTAVTFTQLQAVLQPTYIQMLPRTDSWGNPLDFALDRRIGNARVAETYSIRCKGRDGIADNARRYTIGPIDCFNCDIVFSNGVFMTWPEGQQR
jgi:type II secretion system protein G